MKSVGLEGVRNTAKNMVSFIKEKWFLFGLAFVLIVGFWLGFRITYAPELENSWNAISAVAAWVSAGGTLAAVWAAVQIPRKVAEQQNNISLIRYRLDIRQTILELADNIGIMSFFPSVYKNELSTERIFEAFSFASYNEYRIKRRIIGDFSLYFEDHRDIAEMFLKIYWNIVWAYILLEKEKEKSEALEKLAEAIENANQFLSSKKFFVLKKYMDETIKVSE